MAPRRFLLISTLTLATALTLGACSGSTSAGSSARSGSEAAAAGRPTVLVTFPVIAAVVREVVGDAGRVDVLMPNGSDPHEWTPSAKDIQRMMTADMVVINGLGLEGRLQDPLAEAKAQGVTVFPLAEHVSVRKVKAGEGAEPDDPDQAPGADDPHLWMDPLTTKQWVAALVPALKGVGIDASAGAKRVASELDGLDAQILAIVTTVPADRRQLVTGHESLGYFAERYGFHLIGAVVPSVSSQADASAGQLARLTAKVKAAKVPVVFTELGTPKATVDAVSRDTGAKVVELSTHTLPADGTYRSFMLDIANTIASALK